MAKRKARNPDYVRCRNVPGPDNKAAGLRRVRHYGLYHPSARAKLSLARRLLGLDPQVPEPGGGVVRPLVGE